MALQNIFIKEIFIKEIKRSNLIIWWNWKLKIQFLTEELLLFSIARAAFISSAIPIFFDSHLILLWSSNLSHYFRYISTSHQFQSFIFYFLFFITSCESYQFLFSTYKLCWSPFTTALQKLIETCWHTKIQASLVKNTTSCKNSTATPNPKYINKYTTRW
jgi:hypothetical protein